MPNMSAQELQKSMIKLNMGGDEGFQVIRNYVQPVFKIEKINRNCVPSEAQL